MNEYMTPKKLFDMKILKSPNCDLCGEDDTVGDLGHLIFECAAMYADNNKLKKQLDKITQKCTSYTGVEFSDLTMMSKTGASEEVDNQWLDICVDGESPGTLRLTRVPNLVRMTLEIF